MRKVFVTFVVAVVGAGAMVSGQAQSPRFGLGTFGHQGRTFTGVVVGAPSEPLQVGGYVVDLAAAAKAADQQVPNDILAIIEQYDGGVGTRIKAIVSQVSSTLSSKRPAYVYDYKAVDALAPFVPKVAWYGRSNYIDHANEMAKEPKKDVKMSPSMPGLWQRTTHDPRPGNPYIFLIPPTKYVFTGDGDPIVVKPQRSQIDYECEFVAIIGKDADHVPIGRAKDYVFGYAQTNDVSDRQARRPDPEGSDWWVQKGHDTFKPWGPYIVPKEFVDPFNTNMKFTLNGQELQNSNTKHAIHSMYDYIHFASNVTTLVPGTVIALGTPSGVGTARKPPIYMKPGDTAVCSYEGVGTLTNPVVAGQPKGTASASR